MNILVTGSNGQLGLEIKDLVPNYKDFNFFFRDLPKLDICNSNQLEIFISENKINTVINCAAYTAVDNAENDPEIADEVNFKGVLNLVNALKKVNGKLIHFSTDYVFDGNYFLPYQESDEVNPIGIYGSTKRKGELALLNSNIDGIVIRTSWLYSAYKNNFVKTMMRLGNEREELRVIFDQVGTPTNATDLGKICLNILSSKNFGRISANGKIYHFSNEGVASWYDFAKAIMSISNIECKVKPIETKEYRTPAKRPHYSVLNKSKIKKDFNIEIPYWRDALKRCILKINSK